MSAVRLTCTKFVIYSCRYRVCFYLFDVLKLFMHTHPYKPALPTVTAKVSMYCYNYVVDFIVVSFFGLHAKMLLSFDEARDSGSRMNHILYLPHIHVT